MPAPAVPGPIRLVAAYRTAEALLREFSRAISQGQNLLLFTGYSGFDPEVFVRMGGTDVVGAASRGVDYLAYPRARTFTTGARIQF